MSENQDKAPALAQAIVQLLCDQPITYRDARVALELAQSCINVVANDELRCLPITKKITVKGMEAELTAVQLLREQTELLKSIALNTKQGT